MGQRLNSNRTTATVAMDMKAPKHQLTTRFVWVNYSMWITRVPKIFSFRKNANIFEKI